MNLLLLSTIFIGLLSNYLCQRTLPSSLPYLLSSNKASSSAADSQDNAAFSKIYMGQLQSVYAVAYSFSVLITGVMSDVINPKIIHAVGLGMSGIFLAVFPFTEGSHLLSCLVCVCMGLSQACGWPSTSRILTRLYHPSELGIPLSLMSTGANLAALASPLLVGSIVSVSSWRNSFYAFGLLAVFLSLPVALISSLHTTPSHRPATKNKSGQVTEVDGDQWRSRSWLFFIGSLVAVHAALWLVKASVLDWGQLYLIQRQGLTGMDAGS